MNFTEFKAKFRDLPVLPTRIVFANAKGTDLNQLDRWRRRGLLLQLRRGLYILAETERKIDPSRTYLAGQIYQPSYVSLEYALNWYGLIPERVYTVTSVTTRKTAKFRNGFGVFAYQTVKPSVFRGFIAVKDEAGLPYFLAEREKAAADFVYLNLDRFPAGEEKDVLLESYRFQNLDSLRKGKIAEYFGLFNNKKMLAVGAALRTLAGREL